DPSAGLPYLQGAARLEPMSPAYRTALAQTYLRLGRNEDGVRELRLASSLHPDSTEALFNLGLGLAQAGSLREAAATLETAKTKGYRQAVIHQVLSQVYLALGDAEAAAREKDAYESGPGSEKPRP